jgi:putative acetyltransferase
MVATCAMIRPIEQRDDDAICTIIRTVMPEFGAVGAGFSIMDAEVSAMTAAYAQPRAAYFVVELEGRICGGAGIAPLQGANDVRIAELKKMYFLNHARGNGWGLKILTACIDAARAHGYRVIYLETLARMSAAQKLYERAGFVRRATPAGNTGHNKCDVWYDLAI